METRCSKCKLTVSASELVMRVKELVFHIDCFTCHACNERFVRGQELAVVDDIIYCTTHYHQLLASTAAASTSSTASAAPSLDDVTASQRAYYSNTYSQTRRTRKRGGKPPTTDNQTLGTYAITQSVNQSVKGKGKCKGKFVIILWSVGGLIISLNHIGIPLYAGPRKPQQ